MSRHETVRIGDREVTVEHVKPLSGGGARVDIEADERCWRVDINSNGNKEQIVTTWRDGTLANLEEPDWLEEVIARLAAAAV